jgi:hypothetical protein
MARLLLLLLIVAGSVSAAPLSEAGTIASNYAVAGSLTTPGGGPYTLVKGAPYVQAFLAKEGGVPTELSVNMGTDCRTQTVSPYTINAHLTIDTPAGRIFEKDLTGLKQSGVAADCQVLFPTNGALASIQKGQLVKVTLLINSINRWDPVNKLVDDGTAQYAAILQDSADWPRTSYNGNLTALRFQVKSSPATAVFMAPSTVTLTITLPVNGRIHCTNNCNFICGGAGGGTCSAVLPVGTVVTLSGDPDAGYNWNGWSSGCSGINQGCALTLNSSVTVTAQFSKGVTY